MTFKLKGNYQTHQIWLNGEPLGPLKSLKLVNHSPDGFNWGYGGSGPAQLALAIAIELFDQSTALKVYQQLKWDLIAKLPQENFEKTLTFNL